MMRRTGLAEAVGVARVVLAVAALLVCGSWLSTYMIKHHGHQWLAFLVLVVPMLAAITIIRRTRK